MGLLDVFTFEDYREYLKLEFAGTGERRGRRSGLAAFLKCQISFVSQVLTDRAHLSLEHAIRTSEFLNHTDSEKKFFMLLVQRQKAGSRELEEFFKDEIIKLKKTRKEINERINVKTDLTPEDQMRYYSTWFYSAAHILSAIPEFNTVEAITTHLKLGARTVKNVLQFLELKGFVRKVEGAYQIGETRMHLDKSSPMLPRHHANWRMKAIESIDSEHSDDLHYSGVLALSKKDRLILRERLLQVIQDFEPILRDSKEELPVVLLLDLFDF